jgi:hypothetical protein
MSLSAAMALLLVTDFEPLEQAKNDTIEGPRWRLLEKDKSSIQSRNTCRRNNPLQQFKPTVNNNDP